MTSEVLPLHPESAVAEKRAIERVTQAWEQLTGGTSPGEITTVKAPRHHGKSVVFSLGRSDWQEQAIVAKELTTDAAEVELNIYRAILPGLPTRGPDLIGTVDSVEPGRTWIFLEAIDGPAYDKRNPTHVAIASRWLATFHAATSSRELHSLVPVRGPGYYISLAESTLSGIDVAAANPELDTIQREVLSQLSTHVSRIMESSDSFGEVYSSLPAGLVHGDFKGNNMAFTSEVGLDSLRVFDWSESHVGPLAIDTWWVNWSEYLSTLKARGSDYPGAAVATWRSFSAINRWLSAVSWELPRLRYEWVDRPMRRMATYEDRLRSALQDPPWRS